MSNNKFSNSILLTQCFDDICETASKMLDTITVSDTTGNINGLTRYGGYSWFPNETSDPYYDWISWWDRPITYKIETPSYPVSNYSVTKDGTSVIEIAVSGFDTEELTVKRDDLKIIVTGKKEIRIGSQDDKKYIYKHIGERDFTLEYTGSSKWDYDKLSVKLSKGILTIEIPIREECKAVTKVYKISK